MHNTVNERDTEASQRKKFESLKKYFVQNIVQKLNQNMDLLDRVPPAEYLNTKSIVCKQLFFEVLLAVNTLVSERESNRNKIDN